MTSNGRSSVLQIGKYYPPHMGGIETHLELLCGELKNCLDVEVLVANDGRDDQESFVDGLKITRAGTLFNLSSAPVCRKMSSRIRRSTADIVHLHFPHPTAILAYLASGHRGDLIITYHSDIVRQKLMGRAFEPILHKAIKRSSAVIATSQAYVDTSKVLSAHSEKCHVIPYGIPSRAFNRVDREQVDAIRQQYGDRLVITVGRLIYYKGFEHLIRAMADVRGRLLIAGDGPLRSALEDLARMFDVADKVVFLGEIQNEDVIPYYHAADVFVLPSVARSEAFGIVQLEAMACGKPVVNTQLDSGVPFVSLDGVTGITVPPRDPAALSTAINKLLDDPALREQYGRAGRLRVEQEFSLDVMTRRTLDVYESVMKKR